MGAKRSGLYQKGDSQSTANQISEPKPAVSLMGVHCRKLTHRSENRDWLSSIVPVPCGDELGGIYDRNGAQKQQYDCEELVSDDLWNRKAVHSRSAILNIQKLVFLKINSSSLLCRMC